MFETRRDGPEDPLYRQGLGVSGLSEFAHVSAGNGLENSVH
jgi:hypothetical protein